MQSLNFYLVDDVLKTINCYGRWLSAQEISEISGRSYTDVCRVTKALRSHDRAEQLQIEYKKRGNVYYYNSGVKSNQGRSVDDLWKMALGLKSRMSFSL